MLIHQCHHLLHPNSQQEFIKISNLNFKCQLFREISLIVSKVNPRPLKNKLKVTKQIKWSTKGLTHSSTNTTQRPRGWTKFYSANNVHSNSQSYVTLEIMWESTKTLCLSSANIATKASLKQVTETGIKPNRCVSKRITFQEKLFHQ